MCLIILLHRSLQQSLDTAYIIHWLEQVCLEHALTRDTPASWRVTQAVTRGYQPAVLLNQVTEHRLLLPTQ